MHIFPLFIISKTNKEKSKRTAQRFQIVSDEEFNTLIDVIDSRFFENYSEFISAIEEMEVSICHRFLIFSE